MDQLHCSKTDSYAPAKKFLNPHQTWLNMFIPYPNKTSDASTLTYKPLELRNKHVA
jgi:hypothetical protein